MNCKIIANAAYLTCSTHCIRKHSFTAKLTRRHLKVHKPSSVLFKTGRYFGVSASSQNDDRFRPATADEEWLQLDEKVNDYPCHRTFKAIGTGGKDFADSMIAAVERATSKSIDRRIQVVQRPSKEGKYTAVSVRSVNVESGKQVLQVFREMKQSGGERLKYII